MIKPFTLVAVPFKGKPEFVLEFCQSLIRSYASGFSYMVILFDDGSKPEEVEYIYNTLKNMKCPYSVVANSNNVGYTRKVYDIFEYAKSQTDFTHVLLANSDIKLNPQTFETIIKKSISNENIAAVGGKILDYNKGEVILHTGTRLENGEIVDPYCGLQRNDPKTNYTERRLWVNGCFTMYNLKILRKENLNFNLDFSPAYFEEADLMTELNLKGYSVLYEPKAEIKHFVNGTMNEKRSENEAHFNRNWNKYLEKWKPYFNSPKLRF